MGRSNIEVMLTSEPGIEERADTVRLARRILDLFGQGGVTKLKITVEADGGPSHLEEVWGVLADHEGGDVYPDEHFYSMGRSMVSLHRPQGHVELAYESDRWNGFSELECVVTKHLE